ncbi:hypothetical protein U9R71_26970 [Bacillus toyonensis]|uniref:zinc finger protein 100 n=1 Tax=Bacillus TaxID=1386 RepID=UPI000534AD9C|nr:MULTISPECIES: zinc finger protein 100 [Bacillus]KXY14497.1 hypothetical protein AT259_07480 [Bacillus cereus]KMP58271.1 zinc finger protein 100 [Bacillus toyonensis]KXY46592.1 hypothetical protein AT265_20595 [Bacillus cereus]MBG9606673.1 zinc finger protein 100 [Bacillus toyonensis]MBG9844912.1 zinc finger protein 100 [Bacillus toyonensis]
MCYVEKWIGNYLDESHYKHKYSFMKMQGNEDFQAGKLGTVYMYQCKNAGKKSCNLKINNEINNEFLNM